MKEWLAVIRARFHERWFLALFLLALVPLFPEYICFFLVAGAFSLARKAGPRRPLRQLIGCVGWLLLLYMAYLLINCIASPTPWFSLATVGMWLFLFLGYLTLRRLLISRERLLVFGRLVSCAAGVAGFLALVQAVGYYGFHIDLSPRFWDFIDLPLYRFFPSPLDLTLGQHRSASTFNNPNILCEYLSMTMPFVIYTLIQEWEISRSWRQPRLVFCLVATLLAAAGVIFSQSRGGHVAFIALLLVYFMHKPRRIPLVAVGILLFFLITPPSAIEKFLNRGGANGGLDSRVDAWKVCLDSFLRHPIFGLGTGSGTVQQLLTAADIPLPHAHCLWLELMTEGGLIALLVFLATPVYLLYQGLHMLRRSESHWEGMLLLAFLTAFFIHGSVDYPLLTPKLVQTFLSAVAIFDAVAVTGFLTDHKNPLGAVR